MSNLQINGYGTNSATAADSSASNSTLDTTDFLQLLATQMSNQDVMNPTDNTEYVAQMAQFSTLKAMEELSQFASAQYSASLSSYSSELVGKNVLVGYTDDKGNYKEETGVVDSVSFGSGTYSLKINGNDYDLSSVMEVMSKLPDKTPTTPDSGSGTGDTTNPPADSGSDSGDSASDPPATT